MYQSHLRSLDKTGSQATESYEAQRQEVERFCSKTGFPDLEEVSNNIIQHAITAMQETSDELGVEVKFSGYDQSCSVGRRLALPGSDIDGWTIIIEGIETDREVFFQRVQEKLDPEILDRESLYHANVVLLSEIEEYGSHYFDVLSSNPFPKRLQYVARAVDAIKHYYPMINSMTSEERKKILATRLAKKDNIIKEPVSYGEDVKYKLRRRQDLARTFPNLTTAERYLIVRIIKGFCLQEENVDLSVSNTNRVLELLYIKGLLSLDTKKTKFVIPWLPTKKVDTGIFKIIEFED